MNKEKYCTPEIKIVMLDRMNNIICSSISCVGEFECGADEYGYCDDGDYCTMDSDHMCPSY